MRTILIAALLVSGCVKQSTYDKALADNKQLKADLDTAHGNEKSLDDKIKQLEDQLAQLDSATKSKESELGSELGKVQGEKEATQKELDDLRRQLDKLERHRRDSAEQSA